MIIGFIYNLLSWISNATRSFLVRFFGVQKMNKEIKFFATSAVNGFRLLRHFI